MRWVSTCCSDLAYFYKLLPARLERTLAVKHAAIAAFDKGALAGAVVVVGGGVDVVVVAATKFAVIVAVADGAAVAVACAAVAVAVADFHAKYLAYIRCVLIG